MGGAGLVDLERLGLHAELEDLSAAMGPAAGRPTSESAE
jgi:hypothetical protein